MKRPRNITPAVLLDHMRGMEQRIKGELRDEMGAMERGLMKHMDVKTGELKLSFTRQIDAIDQRLDHIEIELLPRRVDRIERHLGLSPMAS